MAKKETRDSIDRRWQVLQPGWGRNDFKGERRMLYDAIVEGDNVEHLFGCSWGSEDTTHDRGIVAATERGLVLLNRGRLSKNVELIPYLAIREVREQEPGTLTVVAPRQDYSLTLDQGAAVLAEYIRGRLHSEAASLEARLSSILMGGERIDYWAHCTVGEQTVQEAVGNAQGGGGSYDINSTSLWDSEAIALATDRRILFCTLGFNYERERASCPHGSILSVEYWGGTSARFVDVDAKVRALEFREEGDATQFVKLMREHVGTAAQRVSAEARISAEWKLQHPIWDHRQNHGGELRKLVEIMDDDEHIEALAWGDYGEKGVKDELYGGIIAATGRRLLLVSNGLLEQNVSQLSYDGIDGVALKGGELIITAKSGHSGYEISSIDNMDPHDSRRKGYRDAFVARLQTILESAPNSAPAPATPAQEPEPEAPVVSRQADKPQAAPD